MKALNIPLTEFLRPFFEPSDKICLRIFDDRKAGSIFKGMKVETSLAKVDAMAEDLKKHNAQNRGIYFVVNAGGHEDIEIKRINAQFMECDELSLEEQWAKINAFPLEPSIVVKTRKSLHTYWLMKHADVASFRRVQRALAECFGGDKTCVNESRVLRLPGFYHCKQEPVMVECVKFNPELRYTQAELEKHLPRLEEDTPRNLVSSAPKGTQQGLTSVRKRCDFIQHCAQNAAQLSEHDWYAMITNLAVFDGGEQAIHALSAEYPGYRASETQEKINHFTASGTKPMTCKTIAEKGFRCPRMLDGSCVCKAPASMCYLPMDLDALRDTLADQPVTGRTVEDAITAQHFVREYLFNVDPVVAGAFLQYELRQRLGLKAMDIKPLDAMQKELFRAWKSAKESQLDRSDIELPAWYEVTERGGLRFKPGILANHLVQDVAAFYSTGSFYTYDGGVYKMRDDLWAANQVREYMNAGTATQNAIMDCTWQWRIQVLKPVTEINANPFVINLKNGLYNVLEETLKPHSPDFCSTVQIQAAYQPEAQCPLFMAFLESTLGAPEIGLMQEILGYFLVPLNKAQKAFILVGAPNAGKSTILSVVQEILLGQDNVSNVAWQNLSDRFNKAELFGKLANIFADLPSKAIEDNGFFKSMTGEDYISAERKNKDPFNFRPYARFLFSCNEIPRNYGDRSDGFYRRLCIIRFKRPVPKDQRDPNLLDKLATERDGILMWAIQGLRRLMAQNYQFTETEATAQELKQYRIESNSALLFMEECCIVEPKAVSVREQVFERYHDYCVKNGLRPMSQTSFNKDVESNYPSVTRATDNVANRRIWRGVRLHD